MEVEFFNALFYLSPCRLCYQFYFQLKYTLFNINLIVGGSSGRRRQGRGPVVSHSVSMNRIKAATQKLEIHFSPRLGGAVGVNHLSFVDEVVLFTRKYAPLIGVKSWKHIKLNVKHCIKKEILVQNVLYAILSSSAYIGMTLTSFCIYLYDRKGGSLKTTTKPPNRYGLLQKPGMLAGDAH